jgi:hypothetical protein
MVHDHFIVFAVNEIIIHGLVLDDPELAPDVILEPVLVSIEMVFRDIQ